MDPRRYFMVVISHESGTNIQVHPTEEEARKGLAAYAREHWPTNLAESPDDDEAAIERYFEVVPDEGHEISDFVLPERLIPRETLSTFHQAWWRQAVSDGETLLGYTDWVCEHMPEGVLAIAPRSHRQAAPLHQ